MSETEACRGYGDRHDCDAELKPTLMDNGLCPKCRLLADRDAQIHHQQTRDPTVEPW